MEILLKVIELPLWVALILPLSGVAVGIIFLAFAMLLLRGKFDAKEPKATKKESSKPKPETKLEPVVQPSAQSFLDTLVLDPERALSKSLETRKPSQFPKQFYWYYVSGIPGRFATLREAISALGLTMPAKLDWGVLSQDIRNRVTRVKVDDPQPDFTIQSVQPLQPSPTMDAQVAPKAKQPDPDVITKPIGKGAFVTVKKHK